MKIYLGSVRKGIEYRKVNIQEYIKDARMILARGNFDHSYVSVHFAIEELGKAVPLNEKFKEAFPKGKQYILVNEKDEFKSHPLKLKKGWNMLDLTDKILHKNPLFEREGYCRIS